MVFCSSGTLARAATAWNVYAALGLDRDRNSNDFVKDRKTFTTLYINFMEKNSIYFMKNSNRHNINTGNMNILAVLDSCFHKVSNSLKGQFMLLQ